MAKTHYIEMSGLRGCLPDHCDVSFERRTCVESLAQLFELSEGRKRTLRADGWLDLKPDEGAEYAEITDCDCDEPWQHSDMTEEEFRREHADDLIED